MSPRLLTVLRAVIAVGLAPVGTMFGHLAPAQFEGHVFRVLCNRSMQVFVLPLALEFQALHPDVDFNLDMAVRFPFDRSSLGEDVSEIYDNMSGEKFARKYGYAPLVITVSGGGRHIPARLQAIGVFVHPSNPLGSLSMDQLERIYANLPRGGKPHAVVWGDLGLIGEWAARPIAIYGITRFGGAPGGIFNYRVLGTGEVADDCRELVHSPPMINAVANDPAAIGYIAMCYVKPGVKLLSLVPRGESEPVEANEETVRNLKYPLGIPLSFCVNQRPGQPLDPYIKEFLLLALSPAGQKHIAAAGFLPLPEDALQRERAKLK